MMADEPQVSYTTKELLYEIRKQLDAIQTTLLVKADYSIVLNLESRIENHATRIIALEQSDAIYQAQTKDRKYLYGAVFTLIGTLIALGGLLLALK